MRDRFPKRGESHVLTKKKLMQTFFDPPIATKRIKKGIFAYKSRTGIIVIDGKQYVMHSFTSAIAAYRKQNKQSKK